MTNEFPFKYVAEKIHFFRDTIQDSMKEVYKEIEKNMIVRESYPPSSEAAQEAIYQRITNKILDDDPNAINNFRENFIVTTIQRDVVLNRYVRKTLDEIQSWYPSNDLVEAHFLEMKAADTKTQIVQTRTSPITGYFGEKTINHVLSNQWEKYAPLFIKSDGTIEEKKYIETLGVINISGWYDINMNAGKILSPESLLIQEDSRIKISDRELKKLLDWGYGIRKFKDFPFDVIGLTIILPDLDLKGKINGAQIYRVKDFIKSISSRCYDDNVQTEKQNKDLGIIKLQKGIYNESNYLEVSKQMDKTEARLAVEKKRNKNNPSYRISNDDRERLLQGYRLKHEIEDNNKVETLIQTRKMNITYDGEYIGHTSFYFGAREQDRIAKLINPALALKNPKITILPSIYYLDGRLFDFFKPAFDISGWL